MRNFRVWVSMTAGAAAVAAGSAGAIVNGAADPDGARAAVMLISPRGGICTGVIIAPAVILTAAHCAAGGTATKVRFGGADAGPVAQTAPHPGYVPDAIRKRVRSIDLALIRLSRPLPEAARTMPLAGSGPANGGTLVAGGYGLTDTGADGTEGSYRSTTMQINEPYGRSRILVWTRPPAGRRTGICQGDSGGPLTAGGTVFAIATWTVGACGGAAQGALVGAQKAWIDRILAGWGAKAAWRP
jgi:hypothetical protein